MYEMKIQALKDTSLIKWHYLARFFVCKKYQTAVAVVY